MIGDCPEYRLRLFLSADLVGSTAYKATVGDNSGSESSPNPVWVDEIRRFYREFPVTLNRAYEKVEALEPLQPDASPPKVWKTIGDEIAFCCRLTCQNHLARCVKAFVGDVPGRGVAG